eukprot:TRINITY_DN7586_c0_g1_i2.p1 TRINITY_DN7586_c0_g1~~TRINITY_DN7586_c0_g1_i2.p1  ORF type:complete len:998 (-),score=186.28 TRINITY_DN7586_c0_g1_i2:15-2696(-)
MAKRISQDVLSYHENRKMLIASSITKQVLDYWNQVVKSVPITNSMTKNPENGAMPDIIKSEKSIKDIIPTLRKVKEDTRTFLEQHSPIWNTPTPLRDYQEFSMYWMFAMYKNNANGVFISGDNFGKKSVIVSFLKYLNQNEASGRHLLIVDECKIDDWIKEMKMWWPSCKLLVCTNDTVDFNCFYNIALVSGSVFMLYKEKLKVQNWCYAVCYYQEVNDTTSEDLNQLRADHRLLISNNNEFNQNFIHFDFLTYGFGPLQDRKDWWEENMYEPDNIDEILDHFSHCNEPEDKSVIQGDCTLEIINCRLTEFQLDVYQKVLTQFNEFSDKGASDLLYQLQSVCNIWDTDSYVNSSKITELSNILSKKSEQGKRVIIYSYLDESIHLLKIYLENLGYSLLSIDSETSVHTQSQIIHQFNSDESIFILLSISSAGGISISLSFCNVIIFYDSDWVPEIKRDIISTYKEVAKYRNMEVFRILSEDTIEDCMTTSSICKVIKLQFDNYSKTNIQLTNKSKKFRNISDNNILKCLRNMRRTNQKERVLELFCTQNFKENFSLNRESINMNKYIASYMMQNWPVSTLEHVHNVNRKEKLNSNMELDLVYDNNFEDLVIHENENKKINRKRKYSEIIDMKKFHSILKENSPIEKEVKKKKRKRGRPPKVEKTEPKVTYIHPWTDDEDELIISFICVYGLNWPLLFRNLSVVYPNRHRTLEQIKHHVLVELSRSRKQIIFNKNREINTNGDYPIRYPMQASIPSIIRKYNPNPTPVLVENNNYGHYQLPLSNEDHLKSVSSVRIHPSHHRLEMNEVVDPGTLIEKIEEKEKNKPPEKLENSRISRKVNPYLNNKVPITPVHVSYVNHGTPLVNPYKPPKYIPRPIANYNARINHNVRNPTYQ